MLCMLEDFLPLFKIIGLEPKHLKMQKEQVTAAAPVPCLLPTGSRCGRQGDCMRAGQRCSNMQRESFCCFQEPLK